MILLLSLLLLLLLLLLSFLSLLALVEEIVIVGGEGVVVDTNCLEGVYSGRGGAGEPALVPLLTLVVS